MPKFVDFKINLAPKDPFYETGLGKVLKWALSVGRYIVIFTELIVILSFVSRFSLDRRITDLNDTIFQKQTIIESYGDLETNVRTIQKKIEAYNQIEQQADIVNVFPELTRITPSGIRLEQLVVDNQQVTLTGTTGSQQSLNTLINNIQLVPTFSEVTVSNITTSDDRNANLEFVITALFAEST